MRLFLAAKMRNSLITRSLRMNDVSKSSPIRLISYLMDTQGHDHRVDEVRITNCDSDEPQWAAMEMTITQRMNTRARGDKTYHLLVSFQNYENPSKEIIHAIEDELCASLGFDGHQRVSVLHADTDNLHLHICVNKIHPERLTMHTPYYDHKTLAATSTRLEKQFGLAEDNHIPRAEAVETAAKAMEYGGDMESLIGWMQRNCMDGMKKAESWNDMHAVLREHGLTIRERGNGFIFESGEVRVKASSVDRSLSKKRLEERFGPFEAVRDHGRPEASTRYETKPMRHGSFDASALWQRFQDWRKDEDEKRQTVLRAARQQRDDELGAVRQLADTRTQIIRHMVTGAAMKRVLHSMNRAQLRKRQGEIRKSYQQETAQVRRSGKAGKRVNWRTWLQEQARTGDAEALAALRARDRQQRQPSYTGGTAGAVKVTSKGTILFVDGSRDTGLRQTPEVRQRPPVSAPSSQSEQHTHHKSRGR